MLVSLLTSRQSIIICANTPWIQQTLAACKKIFENNDVLLTSIGQNTWDFQVFCGTLMKLKMRIVIPAIDKDTYDKTCGYYKEQLNIDENNVEFIFFEKNNGKKCFNERDQYIIDNSDISYPISIRKNGFFYNSLKKNIEIDTRYEIKYDASPKGKRKINYSPTSSKNLKELDNYLFHWTRNPKGNWPDENLFNYYMSILNNKNNSRSAFNTLCNILDKNVIYSSSRHTLKNHKMVSFTGASLKKFLGLMKWRNKYNEMSYEPYGIGIDREEAIKMGIQKVIYCNKKEYDTLSLEEKKIHHLSGKKTDWSEENEYRFYGNFDLTLLPGEMKICICQNSDESSYIEKKYGIRSYSLY